MNRRSLLILSLLCALCFFWRLGGCGLFDLDEGLYAAAAREMSLRADVVTPRVNGEGFFEKPPLAYWLASASLSTLGVSEFAVRLPSALASTLLVGLIYGFGRRRFGEASGFLAAAFYALSPLVLGAARQLTLDALLDLWIAVSLLCFFQGYTARTPAGHRWHYGFWIASALGTLTKGAPGFVLPFLIVALFLLIEHRRQPRQLLRICLEMRLPAGLPLFMLITLPWHLAALQANGDAFWNEYIIRQHIGRFQGGDTAHRAPFWFYVPGFLAGAFPWSFFTLPALLHPPAPSSETMRGEAREEQATRLLLKVWTAVVFVLFSASGSKLISYILPMYASAALLTGDWCARAIEDRSARRALWLGAGTAFALGLLLLLLAWFHAPLLHWMESRSGRPLRDQIPPEILRWAVWQFSTAALATGLCFGFILRGERRTAFGALIGGMSLFVTVAVTAGLSSLDRTLLAPLHTLARKAGLEAQKQGIPLVVVSRTRRPSLFFYLPDSLLRRPFDDPLRVVEMVGHGQESRLHGLKRPTLYLADEKHAGLLLTDPSVRVVAKNGNWTLLQADRERKSGIPSHERTWNK